MISTSPSHPGRPRSQSTASSHQQLNTLQPNVSAFDNSHIFSLAMTRPAPPQSRCSLPPIRDLIELAQLGSAVPHHATHSSPSRQGGDAVPRTLLPMFFDQTSRPQQEHTISSPTYQTRPRAPWPEHQQPVGLPTHAYQVASGLHIDPYLAAMDPGTHRQSFASTTSASSAHSGLSRTSYSASSPESSAVAMYAPGMPPMHAQDSGMALQRPLSAEFNPNLPSLRSESTASTVTSASPTGQDETWQQHQQQQQQQQQQQVPPQASFEPQFPQQQQVSINSEPTPTPYPQQEQQQQQHQHQPDQSTQPVQATPYSVASASPQERYMCQTCFRGFSRPSSLQIHNNTHTGNKPFMCPIPGCGKRFSVRSNMRRHEKGRHPAAQATPGGGGRRQLQPRP